MSHCKVSITVGFIMQIVCILMDFKVLQNETRNCSNRHWQYNVLIMLYFMYLGLASVDFIVCVKSKITEGDWECWNTWDQCCMKCWFWYCYVDKIVNSSAAVCIQSLKKIVCHRYLNVKQLCIFNDLPSQPSIFRKIPTSHQSGFYIPQSLEA